MIFPYCPKFRCGASDLYCREQKLFRSMVWISTRITETVSITPSLIQSKSVLTFAGSKTIPGSSCLSRSKHPRGSLLGAIGLAPAPLEDQKSPLPPIVD